MNHDEERERKREKVNQSIIFIETEEEMKSCKN